MRQASSNLRGLFKKFDSKNAALIRSVSKVLRERLLHLVHCRRRESSWASFHYGATLPGPRRLLLGSGSQNRFVRIESAATRARPEVEELVARLREKRKK
jgi:hypothetical protein